MQKNRSGVRRAIGLGLISSVAALAAPPGDGPAVLRLRDGTIDLGARADELAGKAFTSTRQVIWLDGPMTPERRDALGRAGVVIHDYLPEAAFIVGTGAAAPAAVRALGFVRGSTPYDDAWRVDGVLARVPGRAFHEPARQAMEAAGILAVDAWLFDGVAPEGAAREIGAIPGAVVTGRERVGTTWLLRVDLARDRVNDLRAIDDLQFAEERPEFTLRSSTQVRWLVQSITQNSTPLYALGIRGQGQVMGVIDGGMAPDHCSFQDPANPIGPAHRKILAYNAPVFYDSHGTHVSGIGVGDSGADDDLRGVAHLAKMVFNTYPQVSEPSVYDRFNLHYSQGARVHNASWGNEQTNAYDGTCRAIDNLTHAFDDQLIVFAVSDGAVIRNPENAKNCLAVTAHGLFGQQELRCDGGDGPTIDGRLKPEVMGPGCNVGAAVNPTGCASFLRSGTSQAAPAISGAAALARQFFTDGYYPSGTPTAGDGFIPSGALLKAVLVNAAQDSPSIVGFPNNAEGWGRVVLENTLVQTPTRDVVVLDVRNGAPGALTTGRARMVRVLARTGARPVKATMTFFDAPAAVNAATAWVNNLDLVATAPDGTTYFGNAFAGGVSVTGGTPDGANNLEQVLRPAPPSGEWRFRVDAPGVNVGTQGFALVVSGDVAELCPADLDDGTGAGNPDQGVDISDLLYFLALFDAGSVDADMDDGSGLGLLDAGVDISDLLYFLARFQAGC